MIKPDHNLVLEKINKGYNFIALSLDTIFLGEISRNLNASKYLNLNENISCNTARMASSRFPNKPMAQIF